MNILQGEHSGGPSGATHRHLWSLSNPDLPQRPAHGPQTGSCLSGELLVSSHHRCLIYLNQRDIITGTERSSL